MPLLLAGVPATLFAAGALDRLFGAVDNQRFGFFTADLDLARDAENLDGQPFDPLQGSADRRLIRLIQARQKILRHAAAVQDQQHQKMFFQSTDAPRPPVTVFDSNNPLPPMWA